jgi:hypothetical protein
VAEFADALERIATGGTALDPEVVAQLLRASRRAGGTGRACAGEKAGGQSSAPVASYRRDSSAPQLALVRYVRPNAAGGAVGTVKSVGGPDWVLSATERASVALVGIRTS